MSCRPDLEVESKKEFLAHINLGYKPEYEFGSGTEYFEFITREFGDEENKILDDTELINILEGPTGEGDVETEAYVDTEGLNLNEYHSEANIENANVQEEDSEDIIETMKSGDNLNNIELVYENIDENQIRAENSDYKCYICNKGFPSKFRRRQHINLHFEKQPKLSKCPFCGQSFADKNELSIHLTSHLTKNNTENTNLSSDFEKTDVKNYEEEKYKCLVCCKSFYRKYHLQRHLASHSGEKNYKCEICSKHFTDNYHLERHVIMHDPDSNQECQICNRLFPNETSLRIHVNIQHTGNKDFKCDTCNREFTSMFYLKEHQKKNHKVKLITCKICSKVFKNTSYFKTHLKIHSNVRDFKCHLCQKGFLTKGHLKRHVKSMHTRDKGFECPVCLKVSNTKYRFRCHLKTHMIPKKSKSSNGSQRQSRKQMGLKGSTSSQKTQEINIKIVDEAFCI